jgi:4-diphosphocytidyl-2-C-methyl-D-erythritol kinase
MKFSADDDHVVVRVPGKINLALRSGPRRPDGYHNLATIFQAVSVYDNIRAEHAPPGEISVEVTGPKAAVVPTGLDNLAGQAAARLAAWAGAEHRLGVRLVIEKDIPVTGGMAGGSADAAGALLACATLWDLAIDSAMLAVLGAELGADVPFCLRGGTALGVNRGDQLTPVLSRGTYHWLLALDERGLSTPAVFSRFDQLYPGGTQPLKAEQAICDALAKGDAEQLGKALVNDLQPAALSLRPDLGDIYHSGLELGALGAVVSGSGPTIAFLCRSESAAIELSVQLSSEGLGHNLRRVHGPVPGARLLI